MALRESEGWKRRCFVAPGWDAVHHSSRPSFRAWAKRRRRIDNCCYICMVGIYVICAVAAPPSDSAPSLRPSWKKEIT